MRQVHLPKPVVRLQPKKLPYIIPRVGNKKPWDKNTFQAVQLQLWFLTWWRNKAVFSFLQQGGPPVENYELQIFAVRMYPWAQRWCQGLLQWWSETWIIRLIRGLLGFCLGVLRSPAHWLPRTYLWHMLAERARLFWDWAEACRRNPGSAPGLLPFWICRPRADLSAKPLPLKMCKVGRLGPGGWMFVCCLLWFYVYLQHNFVAFDVILARASGGYLTKTFTIALRSKERPGLKRKRHILPIGACHWVKLTSRLRKSITLPAEFTLCLFTLPETNIAPDFGRLVSFWGFGLFSGAFAVSFWEGKF